MVVASEVQRKTLTPVIEYLDQKSREREEKHVADKRYVVVFMQCSLLNPT